MASFDFYVEEEISVDEFHSNMSKREKQDMFELLKEEYDDENAEGNPAQEIFNEAIDKIKASRLQLSVEQEEWFVNFAKKL